MGYRANEIVIRGISNDQAALTEMFSILDIREKQMQTTLRFHLTSVRMAEVKSIQELAHAGKDVEQE